MEHGACSDEVFEHLTAALQGLPDPGKAAQALCEAMLQPAVKQRIEDIGHGLNQVYLLFGTALVFVMHGGFAMLAAGAIRSKNVVNILLQTLMDAVASTMMWYCVGFAFAFGVGDHPNGFIGDALFGASRFASHNTGSAQGRWLDWVFQWAFCATAVTIPAGCVAERCNFSAYLCYSLFISALLYPLPAHWVWCVEGWLGYGTKSPLFGTGMIDFAGSSVVHMLGGLSGLAGAILLGPRMGRFDADGQPLPLPGHSAVLVVLGTVLLWFGWYGFNPVSTLTIDTRPLADVASRAAVTTTLAGGAGGLSCLIWTLFRTRSFDLFALCNGALCGFVAVTAGCHAYEPWAAILCGAGAGVIFDLACILLLKLKIDDPLSAAPMHGCCGAFGVIFAGLLAKKEYLEEYYKRDSYPHGLFYGGGGKLLACQVLGVLVISGWTLGWMLPFFWLLNRFGLLRVIPDEELNGIDISRHFSRAYCLESHAAVSGMAPYTVSMDGGIGFVVGGKGMYGKATEVPVCDALIRGDTSLDTCTTPSPPPSKVRWLAPGDEAMQIQPLPPNMGIPTGSQQQILLAATDSPRQQAPVAHGGESQQASRSVTRIGGVNKETEMTACGEATNASPIQAFEPAPPTVAAVPAAPTAPSPSPRVLAPSRSSKNAVAPAPPSTGSSWAAAPGVSGAFDDKDISVHQL